MPAIYFISPFKIKTQIKIKFLLLFFFLFCRFYLPAQQISWADSIKSLLSNAQSDSTRVRYSNALATNYMGINLDSSKKYAQLVLEFSIKNNWPRAKGRAYIILADVAEIENNPSLQLKYLSDALKLFDDRKDVDALIKIYFRMGYAYLGLNDVVNAKKFTDKSNELMKGGGDKYLRINEGRISHVKGKILMAEGRFTDALVKLRFSTKMAKIELNKIGPWYLTYAYYDLAVCEDSLKMYDRAEKDFNRALSIYRDLNNQRGIARCKIALSDIAKKRNKDDVSLSSLQTSEKLALDIKDYKQLREIYKAYSSYYGEKKDLEKQFIYFRRFSSLNDSLNKLMFNKSLADAQAKFSLDEKERENIILQEKNRALALEKENERNFALLIASGSLLLILMVLFYAFYTRIKSQKRNLELQYRYLSNQMNPHFIYNALSAVQTLAFSGKPMEIVRYISRLSKLIRALFENSKAELISFQEELETLDIYLDLETNKTGKKIEYAINVPQNLSKEFSVPPMLIQPFAENSLKHAFAGMEEGAIKKIELSFVMVNDEIVCVVEDNGVGLKNKTLNFSGTSVSGHHTSSGLKITRDRLLLLCKQYKSNFRLEIKDKQALGLHESGTRVEFVLPVKR